MLENTPLARQLPVERAIVGPPQRERAHDLKYEPIGRVNAACARRRRPGRREGVHRDLQLRGAQDRTRRDGLRYRSIPVLDSSYVGTDSAGPDVDANSCPKRAYGRQELAAADFRESSPS